MNQPVAFDIILPPPAFDGEDLIKRDLIVEIRKDGILQTKERFDIPPHVASLPALEADDGDQIDLSLLEYGLVDHELPDSRGRPKQGQLEKAAPPVNISTTLTKDAWTPAGQLGVRASKPDTPLLNFQDEESMRRLEARF